MKTLSLSIALLFSAFLVACSTPTISSDDSEEWVRFTKKQSSSSEYVESSSTYKEKSSSSEIIKVSDKSSSSNKREEKSSSSNEEVSSSSKQIELSSSTILSSSSDKGISSSELHVSSSEEIKLSSSVEQSSSSVATKSIYEAVEESGLYTTRDSVAAYLCKFDKLPGNYVGKNEGISLYETKTGNTFPKWNFNPWTMLGVMIGGDVFENREGLLPSGSYHEADVDYSAKNRGTKRLIYQSDCVIYYTADHYETFNKLEVEVP